MNYFIVIVRSLKKNKHLTGFLPLYFIKITIILYHFYDDNKQASHLFNAHLICDIKYM